MARQSIRLADILADANLDLPEEFYDSPRSIERLEYAIADAATNLLPNELIVTQTVRNDDTRTWDVLQPLDPATKRVGSRGFPEDDATRTHEQSIAWLAAPSRVAEAINLRGLADEALRDAQLAAQADA